MCVEWGSSKTPFSSKGSVSQKSCLKTTDLYGGSLEIELVNPFEECSHFLEIHRPDELYVPPIAIHLNKIWANYTPEKRA
ncbi:hypothetical protein TNCV_2266121 [Trichonephila clavipes]|nr:hypothetical protein TNCV_2266121 [Trichonephila clavipes]